MHRIEDGFYHFEDDLLDYPDAWCYIVWSKRGAGKTYSALKYAYENKIKIMYLKRTTEDVKFICKPIPKAKKEDIEEEYLKPCSIMDTSPFVPINRDTGWNVQAYMISAKGLGGFYNCDNADLPYGAPISYIGSLNAIKSFKGFDMTSCEWLILDEYIPQAGEVVKTAEGSMLLDMYMTILRDRQKRGRPPLKLVLFANAEEISTYITRELEVLDDMADLCASGYTHLYIKDRGIVLHHITDKEYPVTEEEKIGIYQGMADTAWGRKSFAGEFSNNDFSLIKTLPLRNFTPQCSVAYRNKTYYIYLNQNTGIWYMTLAKANVKRHYDLENTTDILQFQYYRITLYEAIVCGRAYFQKYSMYDLIMKYFQYFKKKI